MILSDFDLRNYIRSGRLVINPFAEETIRENGVDLRFSEEIARMQTGSKVLDMSEGFRAEDFYKIEQGESFVINPHENVLACTLEYLEMPMDIMGFVELRSTFARLGLTLPPTIIDANFKGQLTLEVVGGNFPVRIHVGDRFGHVIFAKLTSPVEKPYSGKYQGQRGVTLPRPDKVAAENKS